MTSGIAELIVAIAPEMGELIRLRAEVITLRTKSSPPTPSVQELIHKTPITVYRSQDGKWESRISCTNPETGQGALTGGGAYPTDVECFQAAVVHLAGLLAREWDRRYEEDDG